MDVRSGRGEYAQHSLSVASEREVQGLRALGNRFRHKAMRSAELDSEGADSGADRVLQKLKELMGDVHEELELDSLAVTQHFGTYAPDLLLDALTLHDSRNR